MIFLKLAYILLSEIILLFPSSVGVCVFESVNRSLEWIFTIYQYVLLRLLVRCTWSTVNPYRSFTNGFVSQGSKNLTKLYLVINALLSGQKKNPDNFFCPLCQCPRFFCLYFFLSLRPLNCCPSNLCPYFCLIVQQGHCTYFRNILQLLRNTRALIITTCLIKL